MFYQVIIILLVILSLYVIYRLMMPKTTAYLPVMDAVDVEKYMGTWYEIARLPVIFQDVPGIANCTGSRAEYTLVSDQSFSVVNSCNLQGILDRNIQVKGLATPAPGSTVTDGILRPARLKVKFYDRYQGSYDIIYVDPSYNYALVGTPDRRMLWMLSRSHKIPVDVYQLMREKAQDLGFKVENLRIDPETEFINPIYNLGRY